MIASKIIFSIQWKSAETKLNAMVKQIEHWKISIWKCVCLMPVHCSNEHVNCCIFQNTFTQSMMVIFISDFHVDWTYSICLIIFSCHIFRRQQSFYGCWLLLFIDILFLAEQIIKFEMIFCCFFSTLKIWIQ